MKLQVTIVYTFDIDELTYCIRRLLYERRSISKRSIIEMSKDGVYRGGTNYLAFGDGDEPTMISNVDEEEVERLVEKYRKSFGL